MNIDELIHKLEEIAAVEGQEHIEVLVVDDDHSYPLVTLLVQDQTHDPDDPGDGPIPKGTKGVFLIWL